MAGRAAVARILCGLGLFAFAALLLPFRAAAAQAVIESAGPLSQVFVTDDLACQVAYAGDPLFEFYPPDSTIGNCGTFVALASTVYGPSTGAATLTPFTIVSQTPVTGSGSVGDPFRIVTVVAVGDTGVRLTEADVYEIGSRSYQTDIQLTNTGSTNQAGILYRAADCYLQGNDQGFVRVDGGSPACIVDPALGQRVEQWLPISPGSNYFAGGYSDVWSQIISGAPLPDACVCSAPVVFDNGAGLSWSFGVAPGQTQVFSHETFFSPVGGSPAASPGGGRSLVGSVPDPTQITLDPVVVVQSVAVTAGVIVLVPFPSALFNNTLEENYAEVMGWLVRINSGANRLWQRFLAWVRGQMASRRSNASALREQPPVATSPAMPELSYKDPWTSPLRIGGFVLLTALLYAFLDPTFGFSLNSLAELAGLAVGLVVVMAAWGVPLFVMSRRDHFALTMRALPATLLVGLACVLISRVANFQPGYLYGLIVGFFLAHGLDKSIEGRAKAVAAATTLVVALLAWIALALLRGTAAGSVDVGMVLVQSAAVTVVVAGLENAVFAMLPLRFMPGAAVFNWDRRVWIALMALGLFGFVHVLLNPAAGAGYLADSTRTSFFTLIVLLAFFGLASVLFWAYFRFRPKRAPAHE